MSNSNLKAVDSWGLGEFLAALGQIAQDAGAAEFESGTAGELEPAVAGASLEAGQL
jgi:hypothetical protein